MVKRTGCQEKFDSEIWYLGNETHELGNFRSTVLTGACPSISALQGVKGHNVKNHLAGSPAL
jgi:hypothetical protein